MSELVNKRLIKFILGQFEVAPIRVVESILKSSVEDRTSGCDLPCRGIKSALKGESDHFRRQTQVAKNGPVRIEHDRTLASAIAGIRIRSLSTYIASNGQEVCDSFDVPIRGKAANR